MAKERPVVAMLVDNPVFGDPRVVKTARTVQSLGCDVRLLGVEKDTSWGEANHPDLDITLVRVPKRRAARKDFPAEHKAFAYPSGRAERKALRRKEERSLEAQTKVAARGRARTGLGDRFRGAAIAASWSVYRFRRGQRRKEIAATEEGARRWLAGANGRDPRELVADDGYWRTMQPSLVELEVAMAPRLDEMRPDVIHAHDCRSIGVAVRAALRARREGRDVKVIYDAHEFVPGLHTPTGPPLGLMIYEAAHIRLADAVVTVSQPLADLLHETHALAQVPSVTLNAPDEETLIGDDDFRGDVRRDCGLPDDVPLLVYSGVIAARRGLHTAVAGLAELPGVHLALIADRRPKARAELVRLADSNGAADRLHILDYVPLEAIIQHLRTADVAIIPAIHTGSHEISMPNKFFDYLHAGLPVVVSDLKYLTQIIREQNLGAVFTAEDSVAFAEAVSTVLRESSSLRQSIAASDALLNGTWAAQEPVLDKVYRSL